MLDQPWSCRTFLYREEVNPEVNFSVRILGCDNLEYSDVVTSLYVTIDLYHNGELLLDASSIETSLSTRCQSLSKLVIDVS